MKALPKFSIIIPVYNVATYLRECLDSVLAQTFTDWEAICVDDGSTDGSGAILDEYAARDSRFRVIHQPNRGVSVARNAALDVAKGEWIWFVDADDGLHSHALEIVKENLQRFPLATSVHIGRIEVAASPKEWGMGDEKGVFRSDICSATISPFLHAAWNFILKRDAIGELRFQDYKMNEDALFMVNFYWNGLSCVFINRPLYFWRQHSQSVTHRTPTEDDVARIFMSEGEILLLLQSHKTVWRGCDFRSFMRMYRRRIFLSYFNMYFQLPIMSRVRLFQEWIKLQNLIEAMACSALNIRVRMFFIRLLPSGLFVKLFALRFTRFFYLIEMICRVLGVKDEMCNV